MVRVLVITSTTIYALAPAVGVTSTAFSMAHRLRSVRRKVPCVQQSSLRMCHAWKLIGTRLARVAHRQAISLTCQCIRHPHINISCGPGMVERKRRKNALYQTSGFLHAVTPHSPPAFRARSDSADRHVRTLEPWNPTFLPSGWPEA